MQEYYVGMRYRSVVISIDCPCRKTDDDDDDDDDKYGVRSTSTRDSIQYAVTV